MVRAGKEKLLVKKVNFFFLFGIVIANSAEPPRIIFLGIKAMEFDDLIGLDALSFVGFLRVKTPEPEIAFCSDDEKGPSLMNPVEAGKVQITSVENVNGSGFYNEVVEEIDLVDFAMSNKNQRRNAGS